MQLRRLVCFVLNISTLISLSHSTAISSVDPNTIDQSHHIELIEIIAQPYCPSRLRYRSDFNTNRNRRGVLRSQNNPNYQNPTIQVCPHCFLLLTYHRFRTFRSLKNTSIFPNIITFVFVL